MSCIRPICQPLGRPCLRLRPGLRSCLRYAITADRRSSQSCPGLIPSMIPCLSRRWICLGDKPENCAAWTTVMYSSSGNQPSRTYNRRGQYTVGHRHRRRNGPSRPRTVGRRRPLSYHRRGAEIPRERLRHRRLAPRTYPATVTPMQRRSRPHPSGGVHTFRARTPTLLNKVVDPRRQIVGGRLRSRLRAETADKTADHAVGGEYRLCLGAARGRDREEGRAGFGAGRQGRRGESGAPGCADRFTAKSLRCRCTILPRTPHGGGGPVRLWNGTVVLTYSARAHRGIPPLTLLPRWAGGTLRGMGA